MLPRSWSSWSSGKAWTPDLVVGQPGADAANSSPGRAFELRSSTVVVPAKSWENYGKFFNLWTGWTGLVILEGLPVFPSLPITSHHFPSQLQPHWPHWPHWHLPHAIHQGLEQAALHCRPSTRLTSSLDIFGEGGHGLPWPKWPFEEKYGEILAWLFHFIWYI